MVNSLGTGVDVGGSGVSVGVADGSGVGATGLNVHPAIRIERVRRMRCFFMGIMDPIAHSCAVMVRKLYIKPIRDYFK